ncbi:unnamed protein product [marine sediment metagenome]|uniref:Uncharacterized protein n=1 Tax=marine sediment metagenome TaxID=412755 RepID=X1U3G9_9ZZZZ
MDAYLKSKLDTRLKGVNPMTVNYKSEKLDENFGISNVIFLKLRGSIRMVLRMVRTPSDTKKDWDDIFSFNFGK